MVRMGLPQCGRSVSTEVAAAMPTILVLSCCRPPLAQAVWAGSAGGDQAACLMPHIVYM